MSVIGERGELDTPNGVYSFCEAVFDLTRNWTTHFEKPENDPPEDSRSHVETIIRWAEEFERKNAGREWDGEYMNEIDEFFAEKIRTL